MKSFFSKFLKFLQFKYNLGVGQKVDPLPKKSRSLEEKEKALKSLKNLSRAVQEARLLQNRQGE